MGLLSSGAPADFSLDGHRYASVESFYHALKCAEGSAERDACARATGDEARRLVRRIKGSDFGYGGTTFAVGSDEHCALIARAVAAKVAQNEPVRDVLRAT